MRNFTDYDMYLFGQGTHYDIYQKFGVHRMTEDGVEGYVFDVWAPHASAVYVIGEWNGWDENANPMERLEPTEVGIYEAFIHGGEGWRPL